MSNGKTHDGDLEANESSKLVAMPTDSEASELEQLLSSGDRADSTGSSQGADAELWSEMDAPWPATFERTIALLASPVIQADKVNELTKSPKPGNTPIAMRRRMVWLAKGDAFFVLSSFVFGSNGFVSLALNREDQPAPILQ